MKILLACEGNSEVYLMKGLLEQGHLSFDCPLLLDEPIHLRQLTEIEPIINLLPVHEEILVYRIGDTLKDELSLARFKMRSEHIKSYRFCTKTEVEILVILNEGLYSDFAKSPKNTKPKQFLREHMPDFDPKEYFSSHDMIKALIAYKRIKKHDKDERYLIDLVQGVIE